ncbi:MAG: Nicotinate-nucleotide pyrophosphorylase (carboxylating) [Actinobacteria bacterium ADurb.Bin346]|nr:MAG: Nicotinate-nucleotide pyrophosphorylase (carboxylating) [Actinobacteria bacterium ADurb.Bin346]
MEKIVLNKINRNEIADLIRSAIDEDLGGYGDITSKLIIPPAHHSSAYIACKEKNGAVLSGIDVSSYVFEELSPFIKIEKLREDGQNLECFDIICRLNGPTRAMLAAERLALNFLQHMSGIATVTASYASIASKYNARIADTRKTKPCLRKLEKYAVLCGGGFNHRFGLFDGILIKDNHIAAAGSIKKAVDRARINMPHHLKIEVEVKDFDELRDAVSCRADIIMLDNMDIENIKKAVKIIKDKLQDTCMIEVSGGVNITNLEDICKAGVDIISAGAITHSAPAADFSLEFE